MAGGSIEKGSIAEYDEKTLTATVVASDGSGTYRNASVTLDKLDYGSGSYDIKPPTPGAPCLFTVIGGEAFIIRYYLPVNLGGAADNATPAGLDIDYVKDQTPEIATTTDNKYTRAPADFPTKSSLPGDNIVRGADGSEVGTMDGMHKIVLSPMLSFVMNVINNVMDFVCTVLHFKSPGLEVHSLLDGSQGCDIQVKVNDSADKAGGTPSIDLQMGRRAGLIRLTINGQPLLNVTNDRNVILQGKTLIVEFDNVDVSHSGLCKLP